MTRPSTRAAGPPVRRPLPLLDRPAVLASGTAPYRLSALLAAVAVAACLPTLLVPSLLGGPAVMVGSARGTALVVLVVTVPVLLLSSHAASRGSARGLVVWLGAVAHLAYQGVLLCFATPINSLFLLYVGVLGLAVHTGALLLLRTDVAALASRWSRRTPVRPAAAVLGVVAGLNALLWVARSLPVIGSDDPTSVVEGTGLTTNPVIVQDLGVWLPLALTAAWLLWRRRPSGLVAGAVVLVLWTLEGVTVAADQLVGAQADPSSEWATPEAAALFAVLAVVTAVPMALLLRALDRR